MHGIASLDASPPMDPHLHIRSSDTLRIQSVGFSSPAESSALQRPGGRFGTLESIESLPWAGGRRGSGLHGDLLPLPSVRMLRMCMSPPPPIVLLSCRHCKGFPVCLFLSASRWPADWRLLLPACMMPLHQDSLATEIAVKVLRSHSLLITDCITSQHHHKSNASSLQNTRTYGGA